MANTEGITTSERNRPSAETPDAQPSCPPGPEGRPEWVRLLNDELRTDLNEGRVKEFLERLSQADCHELLLRRIKYHTGGQHIDALNEVYQNLFVALVSAARAGAIQGEEPLRYVLWKTKCLSVDYLHTVSRRKHLAQ